MRVACGGTWTEAPAFPSLPDGPWPGLLISRALDVFQAVERNSLPTAFARACAAAGVARLICGRRLEIADPAAAGPSWWASEPSGAELRLRADLEMIVVLRQP